MPLSTLDGLWLFLFVTWLRIVGLTTDYALLKAGLPTITDFATRNTWAALAVLAVELAGVCGLGCHLLNREK